MSERSISLNSDLEDLLMMAESEGNLEGITCPDCGDPFDCCEPDAQELWCETCDRLVKINNPLIEAGVI